MTPLDPNIAKALKLRYPESATSSISTIGGGCSSASASKIKISYDKDDGSGGKSKAEETYFMKTASGPDAEVMLRGEYASLEAITKAVPSLCPRPYGWGQLASGGYFLIVQYLNVGIRHSRFEKSEQLSLAAKLATLHTTPAPAPKGHGEPMFGFSVPTCCGDTVQDNTFTESWAIFFAERRLRFILSECKRNNGADRELEKSVTRIIDEVVPRLLSDSHLNNGQSIVPVVVHGDLWSGNKGVDRSEGDVIFDPSACYAHNEFELGIMKMFGGFGGQFLQEYHTGCPKTEPISEYEDRVALYELYHQLNHNALFGGSYRSGAMSIGSKLLRKYSSGPG